MPTLKSQHSFIIEYNDDYAAQVSDIIETADGHFIFTVICFDYNTLNYKKGKVIRVSPTGNILSQTEIGAENDVTVANNLHPHPKNGDELIVTGIYFDLINSRSSHVHILHLSDDIELIGQTYIPVPVNFEIFRTIIDEKSNLIAAGSFRDINFDWLNLAIGRVEQSGNLIDFNVLEYENNQFLSDLIENKHNTGTYGLIIRGPVPNGNFTNNELFLTIDSALVHNQTSQIPKVSGYGNTTGVINSSGYVFAGKGYSSGMEILDPFQRARLVHYLPKMHSGFDSRKSTVVNTDLDFNATHEIVFGDGEIFDYPAPNKAVSLLTDNIIYTAGIVNIIPFEWPFQNEPSWIRINKLDAELNIIWEKHFGGDAYYQVNSVTATSDGGVILSGFKTYPGQAPLMNLLVIKLKPDGTVSLDENPYAESLPMFIIYPNPATTQAWLQLPENMPLAQVHIELYSPTGRLLYRAQPPGHFHKIDFAHLPGGLYLVRLWDGEKWYAEKLVVR